MRCRFRFNAPHHPRLGIASLSPLCTKSQAEDGDVLMISVIGDEWVELAERIELLLANRDGLGLFKRSAN